METNNPREYFLKSRERLVELWGAKSSTTEERKIALDGFIQDYLRCDVTDQDIKLFKMTIDEFDRREVYRMMGE